MRSRNFPIRSAISTFAVLALAIVSVPASAQVAVEESASSDHFTITWPLSPDDPSVPDLTDTDEDGVPDAISKLLEVFEEVREVQVSTLGLRPPPNDANYPLYVNPGAAAVALPGQDVSRPSYILVRPDLVQTGWTLREMRRFAAHEYAHAVQFGYDYSEDAWFMEASATWMEDAIYDRGNLNYGQLTNFFPYPRESLTSVSEGHEYGAFVFVQFLIERYAGGDSGAIAELWESMATAQVSSIAGVEAFLEARGVSFAEMWQEFLRWNWRLGHYEEGSAYRKALVDVWPRPMRVTEVAGESCRLTSDGGNPYYLPAMSGDYGKLIFGGDDPVPGTLRVTGPPGSSVLVLITTLDGLQEVPLTFDATGLVTYPGSFGRDAIRKIVLIMGNPDPAAAPITINYAVLTEDAASTVAYPPSGTTSTVFGSGVQLYGSVFCNGQPAASASVTVVEVDGTTGATTRTRVSTNGAGVWSMSAVPTSKSFYRVEVEDPWISSASSGTTTVLVSVFIELSVQSESVALGKPARLDGSVFPAHQNAKVLVEFRRPAGSWRAGPSVLTDDRGDYSADIVLPRSGVWELRTRVIDTRDSDHEPNTSVGRTVVVSD